MTGYGVVGPSDGNLQSTMQPMWLTSAIVEPGHGSHIVLPELGATVFVGQESQAVAP